MDLIILHDCADVTAQHDPGAFHGAAFGCQPRKFINRGIIDFVGFDARVIALTGTTIPVDEDPQLHIMNFVFADHYMRGIERAYSTTIGSGAIETHFETLYPQPVAAIRIKRMVELRQLPAVIGWIIQAADIKP